MEQLNTSVHTSARPVPSVEPSADNRPLFSRDLSYSMTSSTTRHPRSAATAGRIVASAPCHLLSDGFGTALMVCQCRGHAGRPRPLCRTLDVVLSALSPRPLCQTLHVVLSALSPRPLCRTLHVVLSALSPRPLCRTLHVVLSALPPPTFVSDTPRNP